MTFAPRTWSVGEVVTAAMLNVEIRDQLNSMFAAWTSYTPTWTGATTNPAIGNGTLVGRHMKIGRTCHVHARLIVGSSTTFGSGNLSLGLPFTAAGTMPGVLTAMANRDPASPNFILGAADLSNSATTTGTIWLANPSTPGDWNAWASGAPWTLAAGDVVKVYGTYQTAT
ncbi:hypothetical protein GCM10010387_22300 [Streptomyces inusitatus]|uniref:Uncharacterized protein n=1 Tax=Streptomyces inusitatus TaxID=68221 RepID=A0A918Q0R9_9ACTN|nr:hypothetical protein [Streptomyces inusitatus]GGZ28390.1 hypothetical protein GCM10010387_22300 [Streptomyces inusitatus]